MNYGDETVNKSSQYDAVPWLKEKDDLVKTNVLLIAFVAFTPILQRVPRDGEVI